MNRRLRVRSEVKRRSLRTVGFAVALALLPAVATVAVVSQAAADPPGLVALSGVVTDSTGAPSTGTDVIFNGESAQTAADGSYVIYVPANTTDELTFKGSDLIALPKLTADVPTFTVGSDDVTENLQWPATAQVNVSVLDATSTPLSGVVVRDGGGSVNDTLSDGITIANVSYFKTGGCTTDDTGQCSVPALLGAGLNYGASLAVSEGPTLTASTGPFVVTSDPTDTTIQFAYEPGLVALSGVVTDSTGAPSTGTDVIFNGESAQTAADGSYVIYVPANTTDELTFKGSDLIALPKLTADVPTFTVGSDDVTENLQWPATAQVNVSVLDATSTPLSGVVVRDGGGSVNDTLSDGITIANVSYFKTGGCTTDDTGQCSVPALLGAGLNYGASLAVSEGPTLTASTGPFVVTSDPTDTTIQFAYEPGLVALSGVVTDSTGAPSTGTDVIFNGESAQTAADGSYVIYVPANTTDELTFKGSDLITLPKLTADVPTFTVGSDDVTENLQWPATAQVNVSVLDATSTPLSGVVVRDGGGSVNDTLSDGITIANVSYFKTGGCTTDDTGQCSVPALLGAGLNYGASVQSVPGQTNYPTLTADSGPFVVSSNPTSTTIQFTNIASINSAGSVSGSVQTTVPDGTAIGDLSSQAIAQDTLPSGAVALTGALSYQVTGITPGASVEVTLVLPPGSDPTAVFKLQNGSYVDLSSAATIDGNVITLQLTDGGIGDADGVANGTIVDPLVPAVLVVPGAPTIGNVTGAIGAASVPFTPSLANGGSPVLDDTAICTSSNGGATGTATGSASPLNVSGLTNGDSYTCTVSARNVVGSSPASQTSDVFTSIGSQTITFVGPGPGNVGGTATLSATGGASGNPVVFTVPKTTSVRVCSVSGASGTIVSYLAIGTCVIVANQAGTASYSAAAPVSQSVTVAPKLRTQTISFGFLSNKTLAQSPLVVQASASSGLSVSFNASPAAICTAGGANGATIALLTTGACTVVASQTGNGTYAAASSVTRSFTVSKTAQTISFGFLSNKTLAQSPLVVQASASSGLSVSFNASPAAICTAGGANGATITLLKAGSCTVVASQTGNGAYAAASSVTRSFTVSKTAQTISFGFLSNKTLAQSPLVVQASASSGLSVSFNASPAAICTAGGANGATITLLKAGSCTVVASQTGNGAYAAASSVTRSFTVSRK